MHVHESLMHLFQHLITTFEKVPVCIGFTGAIKLCVCVQDFHLKIYSKVLPFVVSGDFYTD